MGCVCLNVEVSGGDLRLGKLLLSEQVQEMLDTLPARVVRSSLCILLIIDRTADWHR